MLVELKNTFYCVSAYLSHDTWKSDPFMVMYACGEEARDKIAERFKEDGLQVESEQITIFDYSEEE